MCVENVLANVRTAPMVYQYVGHFVFTEKVKSHYAFHTSRNADCGLTCPEMYAFRTLQDMCLVH